MIPFFYYHTFTTLHTDISIKKERNRSYNKVRDNIFVFVEFLPDCRVNAREFHPRFDVI